MLPYIAEFLGTMILILLGDGVVANVNLSKSGMKGAGAVQITIAWGLAVMVPAFIFGQASGASFNPALTIALAVGGMFDWALVPGYIVAQILGGICGGILVYVLFKDQFDATEDPGTKLGVFSTGPSVPNTGRNILQEAIATFVLVFAICGMNQVRLCPEPRPRPGPPDRPRHPAHQRQGRQQLQVWPGGSHCRPHPGRHRGSPAVQRNSLVIRKYLLLLE